MCDSNVVMDFGNMLCFLCKKNVLRILGTVAMPLCTCKWFSIIASNHRVVLVVKVFGPRVAGTYYRIIRVHYFTGRITITIVYGTFAADDIITIRRHITIRFAGRETVGQSVCHNSTVVFSYFRNVHTIVLYLYIRTSGGSSQIWVHVQ
jgi:hypothetical protein